ncbi:MAG TPA: hypothetical protein VIO14_07870 [Dehalococcoidia bacterium]
MRFYGEQDVTMDDRGRIPVPARYRDAFKDGGVLVQVAPDHLRLYTVTQYEQESAFVEGEPAFRLRGQRLRRGWYGRSWTVELDRQGRVLIPANVRQRVGLNGALVLVGLGQFFEIWNAERWEQEMSVVEEEYQRAVESLEEPRP